MCKLIVAVNNKDNNKALKELLECQFDALKDEPHGAGALVIDKDNKTHVFRAVGKEDYDKVFNHAMALLPTARLIAFHTRTATSGNKDLKNVHFFKDRNMFFAHNGFVSKFHKYNASLYDANDGFGYGFGQRIGITPKAEKETAENMTPEALGALIANCYGCAHAFKGYCKRHKSHYERLEAAGAHGGYDLSSDDAEDDIEVPSGTRAIDVPTTKTLEEIEKEDKAAPCCDSLQFLQTLKKTPTRTEVLAHAIETEFSGMGFLYDEDARKATLIVKKKCYGVGDGRSYAAFFSYDPKTDYTITEWSTMAGVRYEAGEREVKVSAEAVSLIEGVYEIHNLPVADTADARKKKKNN